jgi:hypothetical protein
MKNGLRKTRRLHASGLSRYCSSLNLAAQVVKRGTLLLLIISAISGCSEKNELTSEKQIVSFLIKSIAGTALIDHELGIITMNVPYGTVLNDLTPDISVSEGASLVPSTSIAQDFSKPVYYTVTGLDGSKKVYKIVIKGAAQPFPVIVSLEKDTLRAGDTLIVTGRSFGTFPLSITTYVKDKLSGDESLVGFRLVDSTHIKIFLPATLQAADYQIIVIKDKLKASSPRTFYVRIHGPVISTIKKRNLLQGDTLTIAVNFIVPDRYKYNITLIGINKYSITPMTVQTGKISAVVAENIDPGSYQLVVNNLTEQVGSGPFTEKLIVYGRTLPFVRGIIDLKPAYKAGDPIKFQTMNFKRIDARFYTVQLFNGTSQFNQNGILSQPGDVLNITIPTVITKSQYQVRVIFLDNSGNILYELELDDQVVIQ